MGENKTIKKSVKKAKKEILEAERAIDNAHEEVVGVAEKLRGEKKEKFIQVVKDLEKADYLAGESCEVTEEAEEKIKYLT